MAAHNNAHTCRAQMQHTLRETEEMRCDHTLSSILVAMHLLSHLIHLGPTTLAGTAGAVPERWSLAIPPLVIPHLAVYFLRSRESTTQTRSSPCVEGERVHVPVCANANRRNKHGANQGSATSKHLDRAVRKLLELLFVEELPRVAPRCCVSARIDATSDTKTTMRSELSRRCV
eukprot:3731766-Rhodomonas_salina.3